VDRYLICNGVYDCRDRSDESGCACPFYRFKCNCYEVGCPSAQGCIEAVLKCDGKNDCGDWSDESNCNRLDTDPRCKYGLCHNQQQIENSSQDALIDPTTFACTASQDHVTCGCINDNGQCVPTGGCIPRSLVGDARVDCRDHSDEPCKVSEVWCESCMIFLYQCSSDENVSTLRKSGRKNLRCHAVAISSQESALLKFSWVCVNSPCGKCLDMFQCESGQMIDNEYFCDAVHHCYDGSDEQAKFFGFKCSGKSRKGECHLPQQNLYDSLAQCADSSDLCFANGEFRCFLCLDQKLIISPKQVCDGVVDCYDVSDECLCSDQSVCNSVLGGENSRCPSGEIPCHNDTNCVEAAGVLCNKTISCRNQSNSAFCHEYSQSNNVKICRAEATTADYLVFVNAVQCDKRPECARMADECQCDQRPKFCNGVCARESRRNFFGYRVCDGYLNYVGDFPRFNCSLEVELDCPKRYYCKSKDMISIDERSVCDGVIDCDDQSDENATSCGDMRFSCRAGKAISISKTFVCDGILDCTEGEDESHAQCKKTRFYCKNGDPLSVDKAMVDNGIRDCSDGSDECASLFSDCCEMIADPVLRTLFWIMGLTATIGNINVNVHAVKEIFFGDYSNKIKRANNIFIANLCVSDFLMGLYLIMTAASGLRYSGYYCSVDKWWRSSNICSVLGTLAILSSETSAFIMVTMSTFRLITIRKPFLSAALKMKYIVAAGAVCWILSFLCAIIPWIPFKSGYFVSDVWFPNFFLKSDTISKVNMSTLAHRVIGNKTISMSWLEIKKTISNRFKYTGIKGEFGYFSGTSVCMPRLYASKGEAAWEYSLFLLTLNFLLFTYMVVVYLFVLKRASGMKKSRTTGKNTNKGLQKRISRLLLTDFCCWIPVSILGYASIAGVPLPPTVYIVSAGILFPINSAMNPILYSNFIDQQLEKITRRFTKLPTITWQSSVHEESTGRNISRTKET